jgi:hypothetical protein
VEASCKDAAVIVLELHTIKGFSDENQKPDPGVL